MKAHILVADATASVAKMLRTLLEYERYQVTTTTLTEEVVDLYLNLQPDLVLLDYHAQMDGIQILKELMRIDPAARVVMMSGNAQLTDAVLAIKLGAHQFLEKPLTPEAVLVALSNALGEGVPQRLRLRLRLDSEVDPVAVVEGVVGLYEALNRAHIAGGGAGLVLDDWQTLVSEEPLTGTPR
jgi:two-component system, NtrC family, nitrogen regulation response regulator NtrX